MAGLGRELESRSWLGEVLELMVRLWMLQVLPFGELESSIRDSEVSGNLAHELPSSPRPRCNLVPLGAPVLSSKFAAQDGRTVGLGSSDSDQLFILRWLHGTVCRGSLPGAPFLRL